MTNDSTVLEKRMQALREDDREERLHLSIQLYHLNESISPAKTMAFALQALELAAQLGHLEERIDAYEMIVRLYERMRDYRKTLEYALDALHLCEKESRRRDSSHFANAIGTAYLYLGDYSEAVFYYQEALQINRSLDDKSATAAAVNNIGNVYLRLGNYEKALDHYLQALKLKEEVGDSQVHAINSIGNVYLMMNDFDRALECHLQALQLHEEGNDTTHVIQLLNNIGLDYKHLGKFGKAIESFERALALTEGNPYSNLASRTLNNIGILHREMGAYETSLRIFRQALALKRDSDDQLGLSAALVNIGQSLLLLERYHEAEDNLREGLAIAEKLQAREQLCEGYESMSRLYLRQAVLATEAECRKYYESAWEVLEKSYRLSEEIWRSKSSRYLVDMQVRFEIEEHERETELYRQKSAELAEANAKLEKANEQLEQLALTDELTGLSNRRDMILNLEREVIRTQRSNNPFSIILCDIDHFKRFNDEHGHDCGDYVLRSVSQHMRVTIRRQDYISRWGGEEFLLMLPETTLQGGAILAEKLRRVISDDTYQWEGQTLRITLSFGAAEFREDMDIDEAVKRADEAMYAAKNAGRNRVYLFPPEESAPRPLHL